MLFLFLFFTTNMMRIKFKIQGNKKMSNEYYCYRGIVDNNLSIIYHIILDCVSVTETKKNSNNRMIILLTVQVNPFKDLRLNIYFIDEICFEDFVTNLYFISFLYRLCYTIQN